LFARESTVTPIKDLKLMANKLRIASLDSTTAAGSGHPTSCLSCAEIISALFFSVMGPGDEFILSKGHAAPILWAAYAEAGFIDAAELKNLRKIESVLEGHPTARMPLVKIATGSLGQGLSAGVGVALAQRLKRNGGRTYVLLGDGECAEGSIWEAAGSAAHYGLSSLCAIVDANRLGQSGPTMHQHELEHYTRKFDAFGWEALAVDGHAMEDLLAAFAHAVRCQKPCAIIAKTFKGKGVSFLENKDGWHGKPLNAAQLQEARGEIGAADVRLPSRVTSVPVSHSAAGFEPNPYRLGEMVSTREAFGRALVKLGHSDSAVVALDADVMNSTMTEGFFREFPERSFQNFIAEQNMAGMAVGLSALGYKPFVATFASFLTRAHDFIRMAQYSTSNIKFAGSHAGISIGPDGPSQMGLEDIPMFLSMPEALVLYPSDAVSAERLVDTAARHTGISYLRLTRDKTPVLYDSADTFQPGGLKVLRTDDRDRVLVIAAGITVHEALKAHERAKEKGIRTRIIDLYSIKPLDRDALTSHAQACHGNVIVVEDHYCGPIGDLVSAAVGKLCSLCVKEIPRSGQREELLALYGIDAAAIVAAVEKILQVC
jgi:transketolase